MGRIISVTGPIKELIMSTFSVRIKEGSTWRGIVYFLTGGCSFYFPEYSQNIMMGGFMVSGLIGLLFSDSPIQTVPDINLPTGAK